MMAAHPLLSAVGDAGSDPAQAENSQLLASEISLETVQESLLAAAETVHAAIVDSAMSIMSPDTPTDSPDALADPLSNAIQPGDSDAESSGVLSFLSLRAIQERLFGLAQNATTSFVENAPDEDSLADTLEDTFVESANAWYGSAVLDVVQSLSSEQWFLFLGILALTSVLTALLVAMVSRKLYGKGVTPAIFLKTKKAESVRWLNKLFRVSEPSFNKAVFAQTLKAAINDAAVHALPPGIRPIYVSDLDVEEMELPTLSNLRFLHKSMASKTSRKSFSHLAPRNGNGTPAPRLATIAEDGMVSSDMMDEGSVTMSKNPSDSDARYGSNSDNATANNAADIEEAQVHAQERLEKRTSRVVLGFAAVIEYDSKNPSGIRFSVNIGTTFIGVFRLSLLTAKAWLTISEDGHEYQFSLKDILEVRITPLHLNTKSKAKMQAAVSQLTKAFRTALLTPAAITWATPQAVIDKKLRVREEEFVGVTPICLSIKQIEDVLTSTSGPYSFVFLVYVNNPYQRRKTPTVHTEKKSTSIFANVYLQVKASSVVTFQLIEENSSLVCGTAEVSAESLLRREAKDIAINLRSMLGKTQTVKATAIVSWVKTGTADPEAEASTVAPSAVFAGPGVADSDVMTAIGRDNSSSSNEVIQMRSRANNADIMADGMDGDSDFTPMQQQQQQQKRERAGMYIDDVDEGEVFFRTDQPMTHHESMPMNQHHAMPHHTNSAQAGLRYRGTAHDGFMKTHTLRVSKDFHLDDGDRASNISGISGVSNASGQWTKAGIRPLVIKQIKRRGKVEFVVNQPGLHGQRMFTIAGHAFKKAKAKKNDLCIVSEKPIVKKGVKIFRTSCYTCIFCTDCVATSNIGLVEKPCSRSKLPNSVIAAAHRHESEQLEILQLQDGPHLSSPPQQATTARGSATSYGNGLRGSNEWTRTSRTQSRPMLISPRREQTMGAPRGRRSTSRARSVDDIVETGSIASVDGGTMTRPGRLDPRAMVNGRNMPSYGSSDPDSPMPARYPGPTSPPFEHISASTAASMIRRVPQYSASTTPSPTKKAAILGRTQTRQVLGRSSSRQELIQHGSHML